MPIQSQEDSGAAPGPWQAFPMRLQAAFLPLLFVVLHGALLIVGGRHAWLVSLIFLTLAPLMAGAACLYRARQGGFARGWLALAIAMLLWAGGMAGNLFSGIVLDSWSGVGALSMLLFILYGVPIILVLAVPEREPWPVRLIDAALALALGYLFFRHTFALASMADTSAANVVSLRLMFDIENLYIVLFALIRFHASANSAQRAFFGSLAIYALLYLATAAFINHLHSDVYYGQWPDLAIGLPFLILAGLALAESGGAVSRASRGFEQVVRAGGPLMLPATLLTVSAVLVRTHPLHAIAGCAAAILGYGLRTIWVQVRHLDVHDRLERLTLVDPLTGLGNRRQFDDSLRREWARARRTGQGVALLMIDVDHFKMLNDAYGHPVGDRRLHEVAEALAGCATRGADIVVRYGGEEFAAIVPAVTPEQATLLAEVMRIAVERLDLPSPAPAGRVTVSIGVGHIDHVAGDDVAALTAAADAALYEAKQRGRNRTMAHAAAR
ncbi:diguanylate cyclase (GGDEF)-like protein [Sphingopyxis panaciterrae]|uniref:GGDEF domain-containing protein n=1 Tax=Sphingopyxis panaciterrae TaxID=363841 RepID=UPI00141DFF64|nr:diguanylate cyclase [Sphingopyxis panaciterrae]NIJ35681.1 diguanylate cyclase (GGDEF)-like protein [Sphingopyxis panaciterrae]